MENKRFKRLRDLREEKGKTQKDIADLLNCHRQVYARYENGHREIPVSMLIVLSRYYGVTTDYLLDLSDEMRPQKKA